MKSKIFVICFLVIIASTINESFADETIEIKLGQQVQVDDLILNFGNIEDSRCPSDLTCVWEGKVTAMFAIKNQTHRISGVLTPGVLFHTLYHMRLP